MIAAADAKNGNVLEVPASLEEEQEQEQEEVSTAATTDTSSVEQLQLQQEDKHEKKMKAILEAIEHRKEGHNSAGPKNMSRVRNKPRNK